MDAVVTDPPYGIGLVKKTSDFRGSKHFDAGESLLLPNKVYQSGKVATRDAQAAGERATEGLVSLIGDDSDEMEVRKQAVFALSQIRSDDTLDALMDIARTNAEPELRRNAMFWLGQTDDPRVIAFFEEILRG